jgi:DNA-directed RNA polymerase II subunit RPB2
MLDIDNTTRWKIIRNYFDNGGLVKHQLESYNHFLSKGLQKIVSDEPNVIFEMDDGGKRVLSFDNPHVESACIIESNRTLRKILPDEAKKRNIDYDFPIYLEVKYTMYDADDNIVETEVKHRQFLCMFPAMVKSMVCGLDGMTIEQLRESGECDYDSGGYFIINGHERVIVAQQRNSYDNPLVYKNKDGDLHCVVRSMSNETGHSKEIFITQKIDSKYQNKQGYMYMGKGATISVPQCTPHIPLGIIFRAMDLTEDQVRMLIDMPLIQHPSGDMVDHPLVKYILRDMNITHTAGDAQEYVGKLLKKPVNPKDYKNAVKQIVDSEIFPHIGITDNCAPNARYIGVMINRLFSTVVGTRVPDDLDIFTNKRVESTGILFYEMFKNLYKRFCKNMTNVLKKGQAWLPAMANENTIKKSFYKCMTGDWGIHKYVRTGVSQILNRLSYMGTVSHIRRVGVPGGKESKSIKIRQLRPLQIFGYCIAETPEGKPVGLVLNLALLSGISMSCPLGQVMDIVESQDDYMELPSLDEKIIDTKIFVNGSLVGLTEDPDGLVDSLRKCRVSGLLRYDTSVSYNGFDDFVQVFCDGGRVVHPVIRLVDNKYDLPNTDFYELLRVGKLVYIDAAEFEQSMMAMKPTDLDSTDTKYDYLEIDPSGIFGVSGSIIPFSDHSQTARLVFLSCMCKQAMGLVALNSHMRVDTMLNIQQAVQKQICSTAALRATRIAEMPSGMNCIVAIMSAGWNQEDSIIMSQSAIDRGLFRNFTIKLITATEKNEADLKEVIGVPSPEFAKKRRNYSYLTKTGIVRRGTIIKKGDVVIGRILHTLDDNGNKIMVDTSIVAKANEEGVVSAVYDLKTGDGYRIVKIMVSKNRIPEIGDKFATHTAQKGTCSVLLRQEDLPFTKDGIVPDIIINSHAMPSRMTINMLLDMVLGKSCLMEGTLGDATPFSENSVDIAERLFERLHAVGFQKHGWERMHNPYTGELIEAQIMMGPTHYQRLKHLVAEKMHARATGPVTTITQQPVSGRARDGGLRCGEINRSQWKFKLLLVYGIVGNTIKLRERPECAMLA